MTIYERNRRNFWQKWYKMVYFAYIFHVFSTDPEIGTRLARGNISLFEKLGTRHAARRGTFYLVVVVTGAPAQPQSMPSRGPSIVPRV